MGIGNRYVPPGPKRGEIYRLHFRDIGGNVSSGPHWAVVVQTSRMARASTVVVAPITTRAASAHLDPPYLVHATAKETGLSWDGYINASQLFTFPVAKFDERVQPLAGPRMLELDDALRFVLELGPD